MLYPRASSTRQVVDLSGLWGFMFDKAGESATWAKAGLPKPDTMPVPSAFSDFFTDKESRDYAGDFWYETTFFVPEGWRGMDIGLRFGAAAHRAVVYVNGVEVGQHEGGFLPFYVCINDALVEGGANRLCVKVNNELHENRLPVGRTATGYDGRKLAKGYFDFYNYSGLLRPVYLVAKPKAAISDFWVRHELRGSDGLVEYQVEATGNYAVKVQVLDEMGKEVAQAQGDKGVITVPNVRLWQVRDAYLYSFVFRLMDGDKVVDEYCEEIGIRTFGIKGKDFLLNGKPVYMKGFGKHEESDIMGRGFDLGVIKRDFELMKWIGANSFRTAHYPHCEEVYQLADREGFLVINETAAVGLMASTLNFFDAARGPQTNFFGKETTQELLDCHITQMQELIQRDKNRACVVGWCVANEPETTDEDAVPYFEKIFAKAKEFDPQKRPCTFTSLMTAQPDKCKCYHLCDFISLNRYYGWYVFGGPEMAMAEMAFHKEMKDWAVKCPDTPFVMAEYGADTHIVESKLPSVMWTEEYQIEYLDMCHRIFDAYDFINGEQVWSFADFQTSEGIMRVNGNKKGIFTRQRQPKAIAHSLKARWGGGVV